MDNKNTNEKHTSPKPNRKMRRAIEKATKSNEIIDDGLEQSWSDLEGIYNTIKESILELSTEMMRLTSVAKANIEKFSEEEVVVFNSSVSGFASIINQVTPMLQELHSKHQDSVGMATDPDELFLYIHYFQDYLRIKDIMFTTLQPAYGEMVTLVAGLTGQSISDLDPTSGVVQ